MTSPHPINIVFETRRSGPARRTLGPELGPMGLRLPELGRRCQEGGQGEVLEDQWLGGRFGPDGLEGLEIPGDAYARVRARGKGR